MKLRSIGYVAFVVSIVSGCTCTPTVTSISVSPSEATVVRGKTVQMQASASMSDGTTKDVTESGNWDTVDKAIATITASGLATGQGVGSTTINFAYIDTANGDKQVSAQASIAVTAVPIGSVVVTAASNLTTTEAGGTATFTVALSSAPTADVTIAVSSNDTTEGTVLPAQLVFTSSTWNAAQTVTATGVDDSEADGPKQYKIVLAAAVSTDEGFSGVDADDLNVTNTDNDTAGITVNPTNALTTTEAGGTATFTVVLNTKPTADVVIALSSSMTTEGTVSPSSVTFTSTNWNAPQTVTVTGVDDTLVDGPRQYVIVTAAATSTDTAYSGVNPADVSVTNTDNDTAGITVSQISGPTTEGGGSATFTVVLNTPPSAEVTIALSSGDTTEGTVSPASLTFTTVNWNAPQIVTVTGVDDAVRDGNQPYTIVTAAATSADTAYAGVNPADVSVTNTDNETPGITVTGVGDLVTTEGGGTATVTVVLNTQPTADVVIGLSSDDLSEGTVLPGSLTFTTTNWNAPQIVTVTGVDDQTPDSNQLFHLVTAAATSTDTDYNGINGADVALTNIDNDTPGITVTAAPSLTTTEAGGTATFTVVLNTAPSADVTIALSSGDTTEGTVSPASLTFTTTNWNAPQIVTVTGVDDALADGNQPYTIITAAATSTDTNYTGVDAANVSVTNTDNETAGFTLSQVSGPTTEAGGTATFTVVLNTVPSADVTIALSSSDTTEGTVSPASLTFTTVNWNAPQMVTVTGVDDALADGSQPYTIITAAATSTDTNYAAIDPIDVSLTNTDNDTAGITVTAAAELVTTEAGGTATFTVVLNSQPSANVVIGLSSDDTTEGTVLPVSLTFTTTNWNAPQMVTVTGVDDQALDGNQPFHAVIAAATSTDADYSGLDAADVALSNTDNDTAGITVTAAPNLTTTEAGGTASFTVVLNAAPTANVVIALSSNDTSEGTVSPASLTFTTTNWNAAQTVTITGVLDSVRDGNQLYVIVTAAAVSGDTHFSGIDPENVSVTNIDADTASVTVAPAAVSVSENGSEATFTIVLTSQPSANVTIALSSNDLTEGTVTPASVTFTAVNWNAPQPVTVTGVNDAVQDGAQVFTIVTAPATSTDADYQNLNPADVTVTNVDNDTAGFTVSPSSGLQTSETNESGGFALSTIVLNSQPTAAVTIGLASSDTSEGTVSPASLTFTPENWNAPQMVTITGLNDDLLDGPQSYFIVTAPATSTDTNYAGIDPVNISVTNIDNDTPGITIYPSVGLLTSEAGGTATFNVVLNSPPTGDVTIALSSNDTTEGTVLPASVTFTAINWNAPQLVTVTGVNDDLADGAQVYSIITEQAVSTDLGYAGLDVFDVSVTNTDNDTAGIDVTPISGLSTTEAGGTAIFTVVLDSQPTADVTIALSSSDVTEGTVLPASVTFTAINWNAPQEVMVSGVDDAVQDGAQPYTVITAAAVSTDTGYSGRDSANVSLTNIDNDSAHILVFAAEGLTTSETGTSVTFTVALASQPTADVTIGLRSGDTTEGLVSPASLVFTPANWNAPQAVTVTGVNDDVQDGNQLYTVYTEAAVSEDTNYSSRKDADTDVVISNTDNDSAGITVTAAVGLTTTEAGGQATFAVVLNSQPTADVTIALTSSDTTEGASTQATLTFTAVNWNAPQTVTVTGVNDDVQDGNQPFSIITAPAISSDTHYNGIDAANVALTNTDNDSAGFSVSPTSGLLTTEGGGTATFTVVLNSEPTQNVTIALSSSDTTEGTVSPVSITFTPVNWNAPQAITVTGVGDAVQDGNQPYTIVTGAAVSTDPNYGGHDLPDVSLSNVDDDTAGFTVTPTSGLATTEGGGQATFTVVLNSQPTGDVTVELNSSDTTEGTISAATLTFTAVNWNALQMVTITGINDDLADGAQPYTIVLAAASSTDPNYNGINPTDVAVSNTDNDTAGFTVTPTSGLVTTEGATQATFTVRLNSEPTADVTVALSSNDTSEGTISPASLTFTAVNWNAAQMVTLTGVNDDVQDGNQPYAIVIAPATSADTNYNGLAAGNVSASNTDNDTAGLIRLWVSNPNVTTEGGGTSTFTLQLASQPTADVSITLSSTDLTEGTVSPASVTFTTVNWAAPQTVTVTGVDDSVQDGNQPFVVQISPCSSADPNYNGYFGEPVSFSNHDNDIAAFVITPASGLNTNEAGGVAIFTVQLQSQPTANVTLALTSSDETEGTISVGTLTFTAASWNVAQVVTVTGVDDALRDGNQPYSIVTGAATSADPNYSAMNPTDVSVTNIDNDSPAITVTPTSGLVTTEAAGTATFSVALLAPPSADVTITMSSSDLSEGTILPALVTFTTANWATPQVITVQGVDDAQVDGNQPYSIITNAAESADVGYSGLNPSDVSCSNTDNDP